MTCRFWGNVVSATYISSTQIVCTAPPGDGIVPVRVSVDGIGYSFTYADFSYTGIFQLFLIKISLASCPGSPICSSQGFCSQGSCFCNYGYAGSDCSQSKLRPLNSNRIALVPLALESKSDETLAEGQAYTTRVVVTSGSSPIEYYLVSGPSDMYVNQTTGNVTWTAVASETSWNIAVRASNPLGHEDLSW